MGGIVPRFHAENLLPDVQADIGARFERLCADLLRFEHPNLHSFSSPGKDGAVDFCDDEDGRHIFECKYVGEDGFDVARSRFREVQRRLAEHLPGLLAETSKEGQYRPWLSEERPFERYTFVTSGRLENLFRRDQLLKEIGEFFQQIAASRAELAHLGKVVVRVLDWADLEDRLEKQPWILFRYFKLPSLAGLAPLSSPGAQHSFHRYLDGARLPYYRLSQHLALQLPPSGSLLDEAGLLEQIDFVRIHGLVITGRGGVGKSRLTLELGREAETEGWVVRRARQELRAETLRELARLAPTPARILLLFDYLELREDFTELLEVIADLNGQGLAKMAFVGNCRSRFFEQQLAYESGFEQIDLTPRGVDAVWFEEYRRATVRHILQHAALEERYIEICRELPMLAAFLYFLRQTGKEAELRELLVEKDFGAWVLRRVRASFGKNVAVQETNLLRELCFLFAALPVAEEKVAGLGDPDLFERLARDGWIEKVEEPEGTTWQAPHDVFADRLLLLQLERTERHEALFRSLLEWAAVHGVVASVLTSLQRNAEALPAGTNWYQLLKQAISARPSAFEEAKVLLFRLPLLGAMDKLGFLQEFPTLFAGAEEDVGFQGALGWMARWVRKEGKDLAEDSLQILREWLARASANCRHSNFLLAQGLALAPQELREPALAWIRRQPRVFATHFLLSAWLRIGLPSQEIQREVREWTKAFATSMPASFVYTSWLDAGGELSEIRENCLSWLSAQPQDPSADFVYKSWLDAGGELSEIRENCLSWLSAQPQDPSASFVYQSWLDAGGELSEIRENCLSWLSAQPQDPSASFVYQSWLDAGGELSKIRENCLSWLSAQPQDPSASFVYQSWLDAGGELSEIRENCLSWLSAQPLDPSASFVYQSWLDAGGELSEIRENCLSWLSAQPQDPSASFVYKSWLDAGGELSEIRENCLSWLSAQPQDPSASFVYKRWLDAGGELSEIRENCLSWLSAQPQDPGADFVYKSWLDAGGELSEIRENCLSWLSAQPQDPSASFVYRSWLEAGGEFEDIREPALRWLAKYRNQLAAGFLIKFVARARNLPTNAVRDILFWCRHFSREADAPWRLNELHSYLVEPDLVVEIFEVSKMVLEPRLEAQQMLAARPISSLLNWLSQGEGFRRGEFRAEVDAWVIKALRRRDVFVPGQPSAFNEGPHLLVRVLNLLHQGKLDIETDYEALRGLCLWHNQFKLEWKNKLLPVLDFLSRHHPSDLWDLVTIPGAWP